MEHGLLSETVAVNVLKEFEKEYSENLNTNNNVNSDIKFKYALCLIRSPYATDIHKGISLFRNLIDNAKSDDEFTTVDCVYHIALGKARVQEYDGALQHIEIIRKLEPENPLFVLLETEIKSKKKEEYVRKIKFGGGVIMTVGGILGVGLTLAKLL